MGETGEGMNPKKRGCSLRMRLAKIDFASAMTDSIGWGPEGRASSRRLATAVGEARERIGRDESSSRSSLKREASSGKALRTSWFVCVIEVGSMTIGEYLLEFC